MEKTTALSCDKPNAKKSNAEAEWDWQFDDQYEGDGHVN
jgi:hypothetical protein